VTSKKFTSRPITLTREIRAAAFRHAELAFHNVDLSGPSFEGRVFFNNPAADGKTPQVLENGYAGKFTIFGAGRCWGDEGHCMVPQARRAFDTRSPHQLMPRSVTLVVTQALLKAAREGSRLTVTVVPVVLASRGAAGARDCFHFDGMALRLRSSHGLLEDPMMKNVSAASLQG
jgi:hypothetical protein